mgnify:CR=1 FL=1
MDSKWDSLELAYKVGWGDGFTKCEAVLCVEVVASSPSQEESWEAYKDRLALDEDDRGNV